MDKIILIIVFIISAMVFIDRWRLRIKVKQQLADIEELKSANARKDEFLANTAHELRAPLNWAIGLTESIIGGVAGEITENTREVLDLLVFSIRRLNNLVNDILDYTTLKHKKIILNAKTLNIYRVIEVAVAMSRPLVGGKKIHVINDVSMTGPIVLADEDRLHQILFNLVNNAIKFTEEGTIKISAKKGDDNMLYISVSDSGIGISDENIERIFIPYEQLDAKENRSYRGVGLGLVVSKTLIELHGGIIHVESAVNEGSVFTFSLPIASIEDDMVESWTGPEEDKKMYIPVIKSNSIIEELSKEEIDKITKYSGKTILIVDDEVINIQVLKSQLLFAGYQVEAAYSGEEALYKINSGLIPDLIILDIRMPNLSGYDVCESIRRTYDISVLPILMLTAKNQPKDAVKGFQVGANDFVAKPFNSHELLARVNNLLSLANLIQTKNKLKDLEFELGMAETMQQSIIPQSMPILEGCSIYAKYMSMEEIGGDYYDFYEQEDGSFVTIVADVAGHGIPAAIVASMVNISFRVECKMSVDPQKILSGMNELLYNKQKSRFVTAVAIHLNKERNKVTIANAGHTPVLIWRGNSNHLDIIRNETGIPIGIFEKNNDVINIEVPIGPGDRIILYTDCIVEARNENNEFFEEERFFEFIKQNMHLSSDIFVDTLIYQLSTWTNSHEFKDDFTVVMIDMNYMLLQ